MSETRPIVPVPKTFSQTEEIPWEDPAAPKVGRWYWVSQEGDRDRWLGCITHVGSNYAELHGPERYTARIHFDEFWKLCEFVPNAEEVIQGKIGQYQGEVHTLMAKVREITARLAITPGLVLPAGSETQALALRGSGQDIGEYKASLILAKEKTLPELFKEIHSSNEGLGRWLSAQLIPLEAQAKAMEPAIEAIKNRIFSVELYAGLVEMIEQVADGEPAGLNEKVHLMQRRAYMDEECLARYETGGMEFADIGDFDAWLARPANLDRLLPFPRCILAFQVRRNTKAREITSLRDFISILAKDDADKLTYLYIRNGEQLFRLRTEIEFGEQLFPDMDQAALSGGPIYAKVWGKHVQKIISENEYKGMVEDEETKIAFAKTVPKKDRWRYTMNFRDSSDYHPFTRDSVYYDDIAAHIRAELAKHNRLVLVLQGLLDRSPVLHPHPPWAIWTAGGFEQALTLIYDSVRALVAGEKPDFEAYRAKLNALLKVGSITVGQEVAWEKAEAEKENARRDRDYRHKQSEWRPSRYRPYGNPGPGTLARVLRMTPRAKTCTYEWDRERQGRDWDSDPIRCTFTVGSRAILNVDAYKPGDFRQFFEDPRTRAEYIHWAPLLLEAEEYHAGNREVPPLPPPAKRRKTLDGSFLYHQRKARQNLLNKAVRLAYDITTKSGKLYKKNTLWRVTGLYRGKFSLAGIKEDGQRESSESRALSGLDLNDLKVDPSVPAEVADE